MKGKREELGYVIEQEFKEMKGRFDGCSWLVLFMYLICGIFFVMSYLAPNVVHNTGFWILIVVNALILLFGVLVGVGYMIQSFRGKGETSFSLSIFWVFFCARLGCFIFAIIETKALFSTIIEQRFAVAFIIAAFIYMIADILYFGNKYKKGDYAKGKQKYKFHWGIKEKIGIGFIVITIFPIIFKGIRLNLHYTSIPYEILLTYGIYLACLCSCMFSRISLKAFINLKMCGRKMRR